MLINNDKRNFKYLICGICNVEKIFVWFLFMIWITRERKQLKQFIYKKNMLNTLLTLKSCELCVRPCTLSSLCYFLKCLIEVKQISCIRFCKQGWHNRNWIHMDSKKKIYINSLDFRRSVLYIVKTQLHVKQSTLNPFW